MEEDRSGIIKAITTPLGFFALSLLIVEGFLGIVLGFTKNQSQYFYFFGMIIGAGLFIGVVRGVWLLVKYNPENIVKAGKDYIDEKKIDLEVQKLASQPSNDLTSELMIPKTIKMLSQEDVDVSKKEV